MTIADQIYEKVKDLPNEDQVEILSLVNSRARKQAPDGRISTLGLIEKKVKAPTWEDFQEARREAWKGLGDPPAE